MNKIYITGITGFLGSNIADFLIMRGYDIAATYREKSSRHLCLQHIDKIQWIVQDESDEWVERVINTKPDIIIHSAWLGVGHQERDNWDAQFLNVDFLRKILLIASKANVKKFIALGSQAEYGVYNGSINESQPLNAYEAYGCMKIICSEIVKQYCNYHEIHWYWLRLFSFFGKGESEKWLIPSLVKKLTINDHMELTAGEQKYTYLYVADLGEAIHKIIFKTGRVGVYNLSGKNLITLRKLVEDIRNTINPAFRLDFGKLPYRSNQSMHMQGDSTKFIKEFGEFEVSDFDTALQTTVEDLQAQFKNQVNESI